MVTSSALFPGSCCSCKRLSTPLPKTILVGIKYVKFISRTPFYIIFIIIVIRRKIKSKQVYAKTPPFCKKTSRRPLIKLSFHRRISRHRCLCNKHRCMQRTRYGKRRTGCARPILLYGPFLFVFWIYTNKLIPACLCKVYNRCSACLDVPRS